jgi:cytochrome c oxidase subunit III
METMSAKEHQLKKAQSAKLILWFAMISMVMMFAGLTSAYLVSSSIKDWIDDFTMPSAFMWSTLVIMMSSFTIHFAKNAIKKDDRKKATLMLWLTYTLGLLFVWLQFYGFSQFVAQGLYVTGPSSNVMVSFIYVVVFAHFLHLFGGLLALSIVIYNHYKQKYNSGQTIGIELAAMFWHFLDVLWVLLFLFFYFY